MCYEKDTKIKLFLNRQQESEGKAYGEFRIL